MNGSRDWQRIYVSGDWEIDCARRELRARGTSIPIGSRAFEIIETLVRSSGALVTKDDLMARVWTGAVVEDNTLQVHISALRKALGANRGMLKTVSGRGYTLLGAWTVRPETAVIQSKSHEPLHVAAGPFQTNVPVAASALIGREAAVQHLQDLVSAYRVVTLTGPGGIGKTVLAAEVARRLFPTLESDILFVELVSLSDPGLVPSAVANTLGLRLGGEEISAEAVARATGDKKVLVVLDNCEHVIGAAAKLTETLIQLCPRATILATSREALRIEGEYLYLVPALDAPSDEKSGDVLEHSAVQLFVARGRSLGADFATEKGNLPIIAAICRRLDGIPLALEFAAARAATLGVSQVARRLDDRFALLTSGRRTALPRHQTLRATLDWSYELLPESERRLLRRLSRFPAGFGLEAVTAIMREADQDRSAAVEGIVNLVAKSLVSPDGSASSGRWRLLETVRAYALEKLADSGESEMVARRHAEFFRDLFAPAAEGSQSKLPIDNKRRFAQEIDNVRAALDWAFSPAGDRQIGIVLTAAYAPAWLHLSLAAECRERTEAVLDRSGELLLSPRLQMQLFVELGVSLILTMGPVEKTRAVVTRALEIAEGLDDLDVQLRALWAQWAIHTTIGENRAAQSTVEKFVRAARRTGDEEITLVADRLAGTTLQYAGKQGEARDYLERVLQRYVAPLNERHTMLFQNEQRVLARAMLARVLWLQGFLDQAVAQAQTSLDAADATGSAITLGWSIHFAFPVALLSGDLVAAERITARVVGLATRGNAIFWKILGQCLEGRLMIERGEFESGSDLLRTALEACQRSGWTTCYPEFMSVLAEGLAAQGRLAEALGTIDQALATAEHRGEAWYVPELFRITGEILALDGDAHSVSAAEHHFGEALDLARRQGAMFWELRAAMSLARLRTRQGPGREARKVLASVYERFTEGFEVADLCSAREILDALPRGG